MLAGFRSRSALNEVASLDDEVDDRTGFDISIEAGVDLVRRIVITDGLAVAFKVLVDAGSVKEHIRVWLRHLPFCLSVSSERQVQLLNILIIGEEIGEMSIAKDVYTDNEVKYMFAKLSALTP